jgi:DNA processing protein
MGDDLESLVALNLSGMVGAALHRRLVERFGSARDALRAKPSDLRQVPGVGEITASAISGVPRGAALEEIELAAKKGVRILPAASAEYPPALASIYDPPVVLYVKGDLRPADALAIGVVGSRKCSAYGERQAARFACDLASLGVTVVSGLARGVDTKAHIGALRAKEGRTIAVLGSGLLTVYPPENQKLFDSLVERGAGVSEFPLRSRPEPSNFPRRNRIISGLSLGVLVVEAADKSGALITSDWALDQAREVFCVPGSVESPLSRGTHRLIKQGAKLAEEAADIVEEIPALAPLATRLKREAPSTAMERAVLGRLGEKGRSAESLAAETRLPLATVEAALVQLAARGWAEARGASYTRGARAPKSRDEE